MRILLLVPSLLALLPSFVQAQPKKGASLAWTVDDVVLAPEAESFVPSPDGTKVVWVKQVPDKKKNWMVARLMLSGLKDDWTVPLTRGPEDALQPRWSPDGSKLAFLSTRPDPAGKSRRISGREEDEVDETRQQIWVLDLRGGEPWALTEGKRPVRSFAWAGSDRIVFARQEEAAWRERQRKKDKDEAEVVEEDAAEPPVSLFRLDVDSREAIRLTEARDRILSFELSPDGRWAAAVHESSLSWTYDHKTMPTLWLHDLEKKEKKRLFPDRKFHAAGIVWEQDGKGFLVVEEHTSHPRFLMAHVLKLHRYDLAAGQATEVDLGWEKGLADAQGLAVLPDGFLALLADGVRHQAFRFVRDGAGWKRSRLEGEHAGHLFAPQATRDGGTIVHQHSTAEKPPRWYRAELKGALLGKPVLLAAVNEDLERLPRARTEVVRWRGALNEEVEGILYYPHGWKKGGQYPLVVQIHGGPLAADYDAWEDRWAYPSNLLCSKGVFVFKPNYHGSSNYGLRFAESIANGKYYDLPVEDIEKGIAALVERGLVDGERVALTGWSNGAILTAALIVRKNYRAAVLGAGGAEWFADWGACEFGMSFMNYYLGKSPLEDPKLYFRNSPWFDFPKVRTPSLILHGGEDRVCPTHHGWSQFRALQQSGKTDVRFVLFPGEEHGLKKLSHRRRKLVEELAWLDRFLLGRSVEEDRSLKKDSHLARLLSLKKAEKDGERLGSLRQGILVPETVAWGELRVGRFEVTRAQFARFDPKIPVPPGTENHPAGGITFAQARAFCAWLSKETGSPYRLGTVEELEDLYEEAEGEENTLDHWAGYDIGDPEDGRRLLKKAAALGEAGLLKPVGSFPGGGPEHRLFDLGGNVAEWAEDGTASGRLLGGSADTASGKRPRRPGPAYRGLRVVLGPEPKEK